MSNPFSGQVKPQLRQLPPSVPAGTSTSGHMRRASDRPGPRRRPSPVSSAPTPAEPLRRKRGWEPSMAEPSQAATSSTLTGGYLDTPAKYRDMSEAPCSREDLDRQIEDMAAGKHYPYSSHSMQPQWQDCNLSITNVQYTCSHRGFRANLIHICSCRCVISFNLTYSYISLSRFSTSNSFPSIHIELPPNKRRRTLVGSIASTALSAALIGTAVGLTVYRL